ncbi:MAG: succinylglutamate desuccinylase/aspartoacylase family protein [Thermomicrobiales bacterium]|nr:succinylglutamate desuccinylase/aspartoacylase family protein [Thermomicrobiales bacterium]
MKTFSAERVAQGPFRSAREIELDFGPDWQDVLPRTPVYVVEGAAAGPMLYIGAGAHGDEYNAIEAVRQFLRLIEPQDLSGAVIAVPVQNIAAFNAGTRSNPLDGKDIDTCYPGSVAGSASDALAAAIFEQCVRPADAALDLHTATRWGFNLLHALTCPAENGVSERARDLAVAFGCPVVVTLGAPPPGEHLGEAMGWNLEANLFAQSTGAGIPATIVEFGEGGRLEEEQVALGVTGIFRVLRLLGMIRPDHPRAQAPAGPEPFICSKSIALRASQIGLLKVVVQAGDPVQVGTHLADIEALNGDIERMESPYEGVVVRVTTEGGVRSGDRVIVVATGD